MLKVMIIGRRAAGRTRAEAHAHLRDVHGPMVVRAPDDAGALPADYVQNHVVDGAYAAVEGPHAVERDLVTEFWFDSLAALHEATHTPYYLANLKPDEPRFVDDARIAMLMAADTVLRNGAGGVFKIFLLFSKAEGADAAAWDAGRAAAIARLLASPGLVGAVENAIRPPRGGERPFADLVLEARFASLADARDALSAFAAYRDGFPAGAADPARAIALVAEEFDTARLRALADGRRGQDAP